MVSGLLPLFLVQLDRFSNSISDFWKLGGVAITTFGVLQIIWVILRHSGRAKNSQEDDEHEATQTWLKGLDIVLKCVGATALVVITHWFGVLTKEQENRRLQEEKAANRNRLKQEQDSEIWRQNTDRVSLLLERINKENPSTRIAAVCVAGELLQETGQASLSMLQALYSVSISDPDPNVQTAAKAFLPAIAPEATHYNVIDAVLSSFGVMQADSAKLGQSIQALSMIQGHASKKSDQDAATDLIQQLGTASLKEGNQLNEQVKEGRAGARAKLAALAPALVTAAATNSDAVQKKDAEKLVSTLSPDLVKQTLAELPITVVQQIKPRIYWQIANENQRPKAQEFKNLLIKVGNLVPGIQNVAGKADIPNKLEVRYFDVNSKPAAEAILKQLLDNGLKDGRVIYTPPTASDLRISSDIKSHFEIWAGEKSF